MGAKDDSEELLALVGNGSSPGARVFRAVDHPAGPCVAALAASVVELSASTASEDAQAAIGGGLRCLEALAYLHPRVGDDCVAIALTVTSAEEWPDYAPVFAEILHSAGFGPLERQ